jgi:hypothetical protein
MVPAANPYVGPKVFFLFTPRLILRILGLVMRRAAILLVLFAFPLRGWALFTGNDQYDLTDLNSEKQLTLNTSHTS